MVTIDSSGDERDGGSRRHRGGGGGGGRGRRDARDGDVEIVSHNREDEFARMLEGDSEGDDDEAKVTLIFFVSWRHYCTLHCHWYGY